MCFQCRVEQVCYYMYLQKLHVSVGWTVDGRSKCFHKTASEVENLVKQGVSTTLYDMY